MNISYVNHMNKVIDDALNKALKIGNGIYPTFLTYKATNYEVLDRVSHYGLNVVKVNEFELEAIPYFLEAPARSMKYIKDYNILKKQYKLVKESDLFDKTLKMYKTSTSLDDTTFEVGRVRAFQKGWLERESNFLHMTYKYLLGLLKAKLYDEFFEEIKSNFVCFMDPNVYGRSTLENSSFIATTNNPDPSIHGNGFVARLSGSTAEMLSIWHIMMFGDEIFKYQNNELTLNLKPILDKSFFKDGIVETTLFSKVLVRYINKTNQNTYNLSVKNYIIDGTIYDRVPSFICEKIREGKVSLIEVELI